MGQSVSIRKDMFAGSSLLIIGYHHIWFKGQKYPFVKIDEPNKVQWKEIGGNNMDWPGQKTSLFLQCYRLQNPPETLIERKWYLYFKKLKVKNLLSPL